MFLLGIVLLISGFIVFSIISMEIGLILGIVGIVAIIVGIVSGTLKSIGKSIRENDDVQEAATNLHDKFADWIVRVGFFKALGIILAICFPIMIVFLWIKG